MLHSYQVLEVVRMEREHELERWELLRAARAAAPRKRPWRDVGRLRDIAPGQLARVARVLRLRRAPVEAAGCC
jgi:hypothetical protein